MRGNIFHQYFLLAAETTADARLDDADPLYRQTQHGSHHAAHMEWNLRGSADHESIILIPIGDTDMRLDMRLLNFWHFVERLEDHIGIAEAFFHIANVNADVRREILVWV